MRELLTGRRHQCTDVSGSSWQRHRRGIAAAALLLLLLLHARGADAQRTGENAVTSARDAFGTSIGNEQIGLYGSSEVRGFSPLDAGNLRIEGFAFDPQGSLSGRLVAGSAVHVGLTAQGYPFPAPTGIVDYRLRPVGDELVLSLVTGFADYGGPFVELDAQLPLVTGRLGLAAGASYAHEEYYDGSDARFGSFALVPRWRPVDGVELRAFYSFSASRDEEVAPLILTAGPYRPPELPRRRYYGQPWADLDTNVSAAGVLCNARLGEGWDVAAAVSHAARDVPKDHAELFVDTQPDGATSERVIADPPQRRASLTGEASLLWSASDGVRHHRLRARARARAQTGRIGGSSDALELGPRRLGVAEPIAEPSFAFGPQTRDRVRQWTAGLAYEGRWPRVGELELGLQATDYRKVFELPDGQRPTTRARPWLVNVALAVHATEALAAYAGFTRGLEESGIAPGNAANRNQALPAIVTRQIDAGLRYSIGERLRVVAGVFQVQKPNFTTDAQNVFTALGDVRHDGVELSLTGEVVEGLSLVSGAVLMRPRVSGPAVRAGLIGERPIGQTERTVRVNLNYRLPLLDGVSVDVGVLDTAPRVASSDNRVFAPALTTFDLGARYRFSVAAVPATLRLQVRNVADAYGWRVMGDRSFRTGSPRAGSASLAVDF
jgi:iron complex outermembrane receptor protein